MQNTEHLIRMTTECILALEENPKDVYLETTSILLKLVDNVLKNPSNPKFRSIRLGNPIVSNKLLPAIGAMECLFEMGFKEAEDSLVLPNNIGVERLQSIRDEILSRRHKYLEIETKTISRETHQQSLPSTSIPSCSSLIQETRVKKKSILQQIEHNFQHVQIYENKELQAKALNVIPLRELELAAVRNMRKIQKAEKSNQTNIIDDNIGIQDLLLLELLSWFKNSFFKWVDAPECSFCSSNTKFQQALLQEGIRVEVYICENCDQKTLFPRYRDPGKLLKTRKGRCGEWASCFTLFCRALGWDARYVVDETDHLWTEIYSGTQKRWLHCDPCENVYDCPLMYEMGWGKKLTYIIAYSREEVQDVTWRYSCKHQEVLGRRKQCTEQELLEKIMKLRNKCQSTLSASRQAYLNKRLVTELVEFLTPRSPTDQEMKGRNSGSLAWRLARGEISHPVTAACYIWIPTAEELKAQEMHIKFSTSRNAYIRAIGGEELNGWENGAFEVKSLFRKEEKDWSFIYLCRTEGSDVGRIAWKFDFTNCGMVVDAVSLQFFTTVYETGKVSVKLCSEDICQLIPNGMEKFDTSGFSGSLQLELSAVLNGGSGNVAWQHAQLFRQKSDNMSCYPLDIIIKLKKACC